MLRASHASRNKASSSKGLGDKVRCFSKGMAVDYLLTERFSNFPQLLVVVVVEVFH
eukprot:m.65947 g.65947  ORF g.65947 m.65947 type:complete len:56 (-) comp11770_c0_seq1:207-374(-)